MLGLGSGINKLSSAEAAAIAARSGGYLLDTYSGAAAAYSLRQLSSSYSGNAVKVRRASDNAEADIRFVNGEIDTTGLASHCGSSNGFVSAWYDQSSNSNDAMQTTAANQPKIYDGTTGVVTPGSNSNPAIDGDGNNYLRTAAISTEFANGYTYYAVVDEIGYNRFPFIYGENNESTSFSMHCVTTNSGTHRNGGVTTSPLQRGDRDGLIQSVFYDGSTNVDVFMSHENGTQNSGSNTVTALASTTGGNILTLFSSWSGGNPFQNVTGQLQELIIWPTDQSSNRTAIEDNINTFYSIY